MLDVIAQVTPHGGPMLGGGLAGRDVRTLVQTAVAASAYAAWGFAKNHRKRGDSFAPERLLATFIVALGVAALNIATGQQLTANSISGQLGLYVGQIYALQRSIEAVVPDTLPGGSQG